MCNKVVHCSAVLVDQCVYAQAACLLMEDEKAILEGVKKNLPQMVLIWYTLLLLLLLTCLRWC